MNLPRVRFTVRRMMVAVAVVAILSAAAASPLMKPYPTKAIQYGSVVEWLTPGATPHLRHDGPRPLSRSMGLVIVRVDWSDSTSTRHLRRPSWLLP